MVDNSIPPTPNGRQAENVERHKFSKPPQPQLWDRIPKELRDRPQWCVAGPDKAPRQVDGSLAKVNDSSTWTDFKTASEAAAKKGWHVGYVLSADDPFACIDLDVKDHTPPEHIERHNRIREQFDSYTERSLSEMGSHVWAKGKIGKGKKRDGVELYSQKRFIICTGNVVHDKLIVERQELLDVLWPQLNRGSGLEVEWEDDDPDGDQDWYVAQQAHDDQGLAGKLFRDGDWEALGYPSQSEADLGLVKDLARLTTSNKAAWSAFQLSALGIRDKAMRPDYMRRTLIAARTALADDAVKIAHGKAMAESLFWQPPPNKYRFQLSSDEDLAKRPPPQWLVKGLILDEGFGEIYGQSGTFKSFLALYLLACIANGKPFFGRRVKAAPAVYVPFEGRGGIPKRVKAWRQAHPGLTTNMRFIMEPINLRDPKDPDELVKLMTEQGWAGGVLLIDTLAAAAGSFDENTSKDMGAMIAIFQGLQQRLGGVVLVIHHSGKDLSRGSRGHSSLHGAVDFELECLHEEGDAKYEAHFIAKKVKDGEDGQKFDFYMTPHVVSDQADEDGEWETSLTVTPQQRVPATDAEAEAVLAVISQQVEAGNKPSQRYLIGNVAGISEGKVKAAVKKLVTDGSIRWVNPKGAHAWLKAV